MRLSEGSRVISIEVTPKEEEGDEPREDEKQTADSSGGSEGADEPRR